MFPDKVQSIYRAVRDVSQLRYPFGVSRSPQWNSLRAKFLHGRSCALCGSSKKLEVHHILPFHLHPDLELVESNLIVLCEAGPGKLNCHFALGHLGSWQSWNELVVRDAEFCLGKMRSRP